MAAMTALILADSSSTVMEAIVEYNYVAQEDDELTLRKGDIITEIKMMLGGWWEGTLRDKRGMFPDNFVRVLDPSLAASGSNGSETVSSTKSDENVTLRNGSGRRFCKVLFSYEPCNEDELSLVPQDSVEYLGEVEEGWWRGRLRGRVGVFPSNFVSPPGPPEEQERYKERDKKETCRVLFPYEAANEDELTLVEGDTITLLSKDAPDKGWWKGELKGQVGLFPDNFVEVIGAKNESQEQESQWHETSSAKSSIRHSHQITKKVEKAHVRKSLDTRNIHSSNISDTAKKGLSTLSSTSTSSSSLTATGSGSGDKKPAGSHSIISSLKRLVSDVGNNNGISSATSAASECREELDGVERGEGTPLAHLTASRAKAPRRRPPSSQHLRHHATGFSTSASSTLIQYPAVPNTLLEDNLSNGRTDTTLEQIPDEETDGLAVKARKKAPWVEELKMNQMERRKTATADRVEVKVEVKKERNFYRLMTQGENTGDSISKPDTDNEDNKQKDKSPKAETSPHDHSPSASGQPAYVPYSLYKKLLKRVTALEEKQAVLQGTIEQLSEQLVPLLANASINSKA